ncbi:amino acid permease [Granulicella tundricola]|uniref:Amino acid permease-associated region n=1 Tax=Granulicella tundricola (strain ATCC BAA-1859 / DSM 23138 / MP5ACTX9) TaxID=1198114 RepID=E8WYU7_GRATM|nr:amino acid permease [Granulicella tundricola]ADW68783.1 amino acid permease-associated region [Granulicella tundricola MP5ACTX9]
MPDSNLPDRFEQIADREHGLQRSLSAAQLSMIAIGGAIGTGLFLGSSFAIGFAGPAVLVSYLIGALITLLLMGCLAEMTVAHPTSGSFGAWAEHYLSPLAGFLVRYAYWAAVVFALGTEVSAVAIYMRFWFPTIPGWVWIIGFTLALVLVNALNVRFFGTVEYTFSALKIIAILAFLVLGGWVLFSAPHGSGMGLVNYTAFGGFFPHGPWGTWVAVLVSLFSFFSIEMIAVAAGEAKDPKRAITQAFRATFLRLVLFYLLTLAVILAIVPWTQTQSISGIAQSPFVTVMTRTHIPGAAGVVNFVILIAALSAMNSQLYITSRMLFSLSRAGFAPAFFGTLSPAGVPVPALLLSTAGIAVAAILNAIYKDAAFAILLAISIFGAMFVWLMVFVIHLRFRAHHSANTLAFRMWGFPYTTLLGATLMSAALISTLFAPAFHLTLLYGIPFLLILTAAYYLRRRSIQPS